MEIAIELKIERVTLTKTAAFRLPLLTPIERGRSGVARRLSLSLSLSLSATQHSTRLPPLSTRFIFPSFVPLSPLALILSMNK